MLTQPSPPESEATSVLDAERSYACVVADPNLNFAKPAGFMPIDGQRIIVEICQFHTVRKLLWEDRDQRERGGILRPVRPRRRG